MDWKEPEFKRFLDLISKLWPDGRTTAESVRGVWEKHFRDRAADEVEQALFRHRGEYPDAAKPLWKLILGDLGLIRETEVNDFALLIASHRKHGRDAQRSDAYPYGQSLQNKTDAEVWASWLKANSVRRSYSKMGKDVGEEPCTNAVCLKAGGCHLTRRECMGRHWEQWERSRWVTYLQSKGLLVPSYLLEPVFSEVG
ncbi:MAG: hypothetical protein JSU86_01775 [Phycisphaerales bacterium]|nr:MAG: hypothetical protein JSU86_01775 [Phycisphaerales bacterium]